MPKAPVVDEAAKQQQVKLTMACVQSVRTARRAWGSQQIDNSNVLEKAHGNDFVAKPLLDVLRKAINDGNSVSEQLCSADKAYRSSSVFIHRAPPHNKFYI